jgi:hypothetical protein
VKKSSRVKYVSHIHSWPRTLAKMFWFRQKNLSSPIKMRFHFVLIILLHCDGHLFTLVRAEDSDLQEVDFTLGQFFQTQALTYSIEFWLLQKNWPRYTINWYVWTYVHTHTPGSFDLCWAESFDRHRKILTFTKIFCPHQKFKRFEYKIFLNLQQKFRLQKFFLTSTNTYCIRLKPKYYQGKIFHKCTYICMYLCRCVRQSYLKVTT